MLLNDCIWRKIMHGVKILHLSIHHHRFMKMCKNVEENIYYGNKHFYTAYYIYWFHIYNNISHSSPSPSKKYWTVNNFEYVDTKWISLKTSFPVKFLTTFYFVEARNQPTKIVVIYFLIFDDNHLTNSYYSSTDSKISSLLDTWVISKSSYINYKTETD